MPPFDGWNLLEHVDVDPLVLSYESVLDDDDQSLLATLLRKMPIISLYYVHGQYHVDFMQVGVLIMTNRVFSFKLLDMLMETIVAILSLYLYIYELVQANAPFSKHVSSNGNIGKQQYLD